MMVNHDRITIQDCVDMCEKRGLAALVNDGEVKGFHDDRTQEMLDGLIIKDWLTALAETYTKMQGIACFDSNISAIGPGWGIQLDTGIDIIAEKTGITLNEELRGSEYPYKYSFIYNDILFYQVSRERLFTGIPEDTQEKAG